MYKPLQDVTIPVLPFVPRVDVVAAAGGGNAGSLPGRLNIVAVFRIIDEHYPQNKRETVVVIATRPIPTERKTT